MNPTSSLNFYRLQLLTGRTHQIRAQLSYEKNPIFNDLLYGGSTLPKELKKICVFDNSQFEHYALRCSELKFDYKGITFEWNMSRFKNCFSQK
jgi:23S rRNA-/tRNA-specific pseudouridylate synthase